MSLLPATGAKGTPPTYDQEQMLTFLDGLAAGLCMEEALALTDMKLSTLTRWIYSDYPEGLMQAYLAAKKMGVEVIVSQAFQIADDNSRDQEMGHTKQGTTITNTNAPARDRLRVDTRKWYASKIAPKMYGDRVEVEHTGDVGGATVQVITGIPGPPGEKLGEEIPDAEFTEVQPATDIEDLL